MVIIDQGGETLRSVIKVVDEQRRRRREHVREAIKAAAVPMPAEVVHNVAQLNSRDAREVLRDHPGFSLWEKRNSYEISLRVFDRSMDDLLRAIQNFEELSRDGTIFNRTREYELGEIEKAVQKELFATANAVHSLVEHSTRRLQKSIQVSGYDERRQECFGDDRLHEFVIGMRTILHHVQMLRPGWQVQHRFGKEGHLASFKLDKDEVSLAVEQAKDSLSSTMLAHVRHYLNEAPEKIDLRQVFGDYRRRADEFHSWFLEAIETETLEDLRDYERCIKENKNFAARTWWRAMLVNWLNWDQPPNPYKHLDRYLTPEQLEEVYRLPIGSKEQVDRVIEFVDTDGACDDELRHLTYQLFRRATP